MLDEGELAGWVQRMMGHERDDGKAFMENAYNAGKDEEVDEKGVESG